ncbi:MAG TPA: hypothetical protein VF761_16685 [Gemmatimonadaceae bacterium]
MAASELTIDVSGQLREWYDNPIAFTEALILGRPMNRHEMRVVNALFSAGHETPDPARDIMEYLKPQALRIVAALGLNTDSGRRRRRKAGHLETLRAFRQQPDIYPALRYEHRWIRSRCGFCRALYASETFISFVQLMTGRRMYVLEREDVLDCGHPSALLYPVEWERDGRPVPCASKGA